MAMIRAIVAEGTTPAETVAIALIVAAKFGLPLLIVPFPFVAAGPTSSSTPSTATC